MAINMHIKTKDMDLTPHISAQIHEKLDVIEKLLAPEPAETILAEVEVGQDSRHHQTGDIYQAEVHVRYKGEQYRAVAKGESVIVALDALKDDIAEVIRHKKTREQTLLRRGSRLIKKFFRGK